MTGPCVRWNAAGRYVVSCHGANVLINEGPVIGVVGQGATTQPAQIGVLDPEKGSLIGRSEHTAADECQ